MAVGSDDIFWDYDNLASDTQAKLGKLLKDFPPLSKTPSISPGQMEPAYVDDDSKKHLDMLESALRVAVPNTEASGESPEPFESRRSGKKRKRSDTAGLSRAFRPKKCNPDCTLSEDPDHFMVGCDGCKKWYHGSCVNLTKKQADIILVYYCVKCEPTSGPSVKKTRTNTHRRDYFDPEPGSKKTEVGTAQFIKELKERDGTFADVEEVVETKKGRELDMEYMEKNGFKKLIRIEERSGLDLIIPPESFYYDDVVRILGNDRTVSAIDVESQEENVIITLRQYLHYMKAEPRETVINVISLEFSNSPMSKLVEPPRIVRELSWVDNYFRDDRTDLPPESPYAKPEVQKYCLMSAKDSYTDFHIDFGGTSVWYHIFKGTKVFYLIEPTDANLTLYEEWMRSSDQSTRFLGFETTKCYRLVLQQGNTILMPSGWIHAVYTPEDSLVFGGNFLHHFAVETQFKINKMEDRLKTPERYRFPHFYHVCWSAFEELVGKLEDFIDDIPKNWPKWLVKATCTLRDTLKDDKPEAVSPEELKRRKDEMKEDIDYRSLLRKADVLLKKTARVHAAATGAPVKI